MLFESGAILQYLSENYANEVRDAATRASISQWILFANSTLAITLFVPSNKEREFPRLMAYRWPAAVVLSSLVLAVTAAKLLSRPIPIAIKGGLQVDK